MEEVTLNRTDIEAVVSIIDIVSQRGAFKGEELAAVGSVRQKYAAFLASIDKANAEKEQEEVVLEEPSEE